MNTISTMQSHAENYLGARRRLGFSLRTTGLAAMSFARYVDGLGHEGPLTVEMMADGARRDRWHRDDPATWARRLKKLRSFARYLQPFEPRTEVPDDSTFGRIGQRLAPHIDSEPEIVDWLAAARRLGPTPGLRGAPYEALFGLMAATGLRVSEAVHLQNGEVDLKRGVLTVRQTKVAKSRQVPLHPSTQATLKQYCWLRNLQVAATDETPCFGGTRGRRRGQGLSLRQVQRVFIGLRDQLGWVNRGAHGGPRQGDQHLLVPHRRTRTHGGGGGQVRVLREPECLRSDTPPHVLWIVCSCSITSAVILI
jgi:integrase